MKVCLSPPFCVRKLLDHFFRWKYNIRPIWREEFAKLGVSGYTCIGVCIVPARCSSQARVRCGGMYYTGWVWHDWKRIQRYSVDFFGERSSAHHPKILRKGWSVDLTGTKVDLMGHEPTTGLLVYIEGVRVDGLLAGVRTLIFKQLSDWQKIELDRIVDAGEEVGERSKAVVHIFGIGKRQRPLNAMSAANSMRDILARTRSGIRPVGVTVMGLEWDWRWKIVRGSCSRQRMGYVGIGLDGEKVWI